MTKVSSSSTLSQDQGDDLVGSERVKVCAESLQEAKLLLKIKMRGGEERIFKEHG